MNTPFGKDKMPVEVGIMFFKMPIKHLISLFFAMRLNPLCDTWYHKELFYKKSTVIFMPHKRELYTTKIIILATF
jgi:hypothetical protein